MEESMKMRTVIGALVLALCIFATPLWSDESAPAGTEQAMPAMGPPTEMKQVKFLIGEWVVKGKMKMQPTDTNWMDLTATASYKMIAGGAALQMEYKGPMMGQDFIGIAFRTYDRETKQWQQAWVDNFGARISIYTGGKKGDKWVFSGEDKYGGMTMLGRTTEYDINEGSFKFKMESSVDGGKTWFTGVEATYTKK
jgi:hypothetical protein